MHEASAVPPSGASPPPNSRRALYVAVAVAALIVVIGLSTFSWLVMAYPDRKGGGRGELLELRIAEGSTLRQVAAQLAAGGAIERPRLWTLYARVRGARSRLRSGTVLVYDDMTPLQLLQRVARGYGAAEVRVVLPEGFSRYDIARRFARFGLCTAEAFVQQTQDPRLLSEYGIEGDSAEGFLFPDTYRLHDAIGAHELARRLLENGKARLGPVLRAHAARVEALRTELGFGEREIVTLASIVEKEAAVPAEQPVIAGVFLNRLRDPEFQPKRLQADPTVAYGCLRRPQLAACAGFDGRRVTRAMLSDADNAYNTYRHAGLPPGPIANPGLSAVLAVLEPAQHDYYYFVARGDGRHAFSATLEEHNLAVDSYRR